METLHGLVAAYLATSHRTKKELAETLTCTPETLNNKLEGRTALTVSEARTIAEFIGVPIDRVCELAPL